MPFHMDARRALAILALSLAATACGDATAPVAPDAPSLGKGGPNALPTNGRIYFTSSFTGNQELYSVNPDGSDRRRLTFTAEQEFEVAVSRDGKKLVFVAGTEATGSDLYTMNADGSNRRRVTTLNDALVRSPSWSPDGKTILFNRHAGDGFVSVWTVSASGSGLKRLTAPGVPAASAAWSPDGGRIVYSRYQPGVETEYQLYLIDPDGTDDTLLYDCGASMCEWPSWAPDGRRIVFSRNDILGTCLMDYATPFCVGGDGVGTRAVYSPDGSRLAIAGPIVVGEPQRLFTMEANGAALTPISDELHRISGLAWGR